MRVYVLALTIILTGCQSSKITYSVPYFWPINIRLGTEISLVSGQLKFDTIHYKVVGYANHLKKFRLQRTDLDKLDFDNNYADSIALYFYKNRLFSIDISASDNRRVEYLKFAIKDKRESGLGLGGYATSDTTSHYGKYRKLNYWSRDRHLRYEYSEDIVENVAKLTISNEKMVKVMPEPKSIH